MDDDDGSANRAREAQEKDTSSQIHQPEGSAFHSQLQYVANPQVQSAQNVAHYGQQPFDMGALAGALPHPSQHPMTMLPQYGRADMPGMMANPFQMHPPQQYALGRNPQQQQHQYGGAAFQQQSTMAQRPPANMQTQGQFSHMDPWGYGLSQMQIPQLDPRFAPQGPFALHPAVSGDPAQFMRRASEPAPVPSYPRGPPRKPKQSGHALWVGNLPPGATVSELKDHFSRDATSDIDSLFLISKSNCAFVNYRTEEACTAAMNRFHDSRFNGVRLVCRLRRGGSTASVAAETSESQSSPDILSPTSNLTVPEEPTTPTIVGSPVPEASEQSPDPSTSGVSPERVEDRFFIVKSLTVQDLESSVRNGIWATQSHNEVRLNRAYDEAENVYLIFSANKSGEYFGYARMASTIAGEPVNLNSNAAAYEPVSPGAPQSIPTPATATAPKGRIIDDSARGTIFWEADRSDTERDESPDKEIGEAATGQHWGRQFSIEWVSTTRLPFYRTRGLRNPWNGNREVKIARDGTELEPSIGRRLVQMFHRPLTNPSAPQATGQFR